MKESELMNLLSAMKVQQENLSDSSVLGQQNTAQQVKENSKRNPIPDYWILVLKSGVAGMQFHVSEDETEGARILGSITPGTELRLEREYKNEYDQWAIKIFYQDKMLGYMTRFKNETIARLMDVGKIFHAIVDKPVELPQDREELRRIQTPTENFDLPYSVYMEDDAAYDEEERDDE